MNIRRSGSVKNEIERIFMKEKFMAKYHQVLVSATTACAFLSLGLSTSSAQVYVPPTYVPMYEGGSSRDLGFYLDSDIGPSFMPDFQSSRFGFPGNFATRPGVRFGVEPGFNFMAAGPLTLGAEFETGVIYNYLHSITDAGAATSLRGDYYQVPLLGNLVFKFHTDSIVVPYIGVGAGGDYSQARIDTPGFFGFGDGFGQTRDDRIDPAVQGMAGVRFRINPMCEAGLGYKFLADFPNSGRYIATHAVQATFSVKF
jgi:opacity protein-like surface antigen